MELGYVNANIVATIDYILLHNFEQDNFIYIFSPISFWAKLKQMEFSYLAVCLHVERGKGRVRAEPQRGKRDVSET